LRLAKDDNRNSHRAETELGLRCIGRPSRGGGECGAKTPCPGSLGPSVTARDAWQQVLSRNITYEECAPEDSVAYVGGAAKGGLALVGLPDCESSALCGQANVAVIFQLQPMAPKGVQHGLGGSLGEVGHPARCQRTTIGRKIDGQKDASS
jgi:hypothetical protein